MLTLILITSCRSRQYCRFPLRTQHHKSTAFSFLPPWLMILSHRPQRFSPIQRGKHFTRAVCMLVTKHGNIRRTNVTGYFSPELLDHIKRKKGERILALHSADGEGGSGGVEVNTSGLH